MRHDAEALRDITTAYDRLVTSLQLTVSDLGAQTQRARAAGQTINTAWLFRERRLKRLLDQAEQQLATFTTQLNARLTNDQRAAVTLAQEHANQLLSATDVEITFTRLPTAAIETIVGFSGDGSPLTKLLNQIPGDATARIRETLIAGLATGQNPRQTARQISNALQGNLARAHTIARTETLRAYREASRQTAKAAGVDRWEWIASKSQRTCLACLAMDGRIFSIEKPQPNHPNCRCTVLYLPPGYGPPARETGAQWFQKQPDEVKATMMSKVAFEAYQKGEIKLQDFIGIRRSKVWGETRFELSLKEIRRLKAEKAAKPKPVRQPKPKPLPVPVDPFPADITTLQELRTLGGSTGAKLVRDPATGNQFVLKRGASADHLREESHADNLYRAFGVNVPEHRLYETATGPVKLSQFVEGKTLSSLKGQALETAHEQLREHFVVDALLGNWDVIGLNADNVLVDTAGKVWRIDNGGSLRFRAMGALKTPDEWNAYPVELWSLRKASVNPQTAGVFDQLTIYDLRRQIESLSPFNLGNVPNLPTEIRDVLLGRFEQMRYVGQAARTFEDDLWKAGYTDGFTEHIIGLRKAGIVEKLPKELTQAAGNVYPKDENGKLFDNLRGYGSIMQDVTNYMTRNGAVQKIIARWAGEQAGSSWSAAAQAIKEFWIRQRTVARDKHFWLSGEQAAENYTKLLKKYDEKTVTTTWQIQHALTYELLGKTQFRYNDRAARIVRLIRTESLDIMQKYGLKPGMSGVIQRGAHESSSIFKDVYVKGYETTIQEVPHHRVTAAYFFSRDVSSADFFLGDGENELLFLTEGIELRYTGTRKAPDLDKGIDWKAKKPNGK